MIAVQIADIGSFMTKFLRSEIFDPFEFMEGTLQTRITYDFDGHILSDSYSEDELREEGLFGHTYLPFSLFLLLVVCHILAMTKLPKSQ